MENIKSEIEGLPYEAYPPGEEAKTEKSRQIGKWTLRRMSGDLNTFKIPGSKGETSNAELIENEGKTQKELNAELDEAQAVDGRIRVFQAKAGRRLSRLSNLNMMKEAA